mmetsp:Transcript_6545/g.22091  ORF Transcript_6545/g.22091 Transcript_6545/m.22091 type:complete len:136 (-) Transcript_6545:36-443(-)
MARNEPPPPPYEAQAANPFASDAGPAGASEGGEGWVVEPFKAEFDVMFSSHGPDAEGYLSAERAREALVATGLDRAKLRDIWTLSDLDADGKLDSVEFAIAMYLCRQAQAGHPVPTSLPSNMLPASRRVAASNPF